MQLDESGDTPMHPVCLFFAQHCSSPDSAGGAEDKAADLRCELQLGWTKMFATENVEI